ncbi:MAG: hypothetical protein U5K37_08190 [Natrialbaceae archaeon]|nr:hypothetical protein [Natrialbaceae archaeon]
MHITVENVGDETAESVSVTAEFESADTELARAGDRSRDYCGRWDIDSIVAHATAES